MDSQEKIWSFILSSLEQKLRVMLLYVLESKGSSPGRQGFFMAVNANYQMEGSIGGGIMEHKFVELAKDKMKRAAFAEAAGDVRKQVHDKEAVKNQSGMICSGEQTILLYPVQQNDVAVIGNILSTVKQNLNATLILTPNGIQFDKRIPQNDFEYSYNSESDWIYKEKIGYKNKLFIIGGGHCALALSRLMRTMDFYVQVYDERKELKTMLENDVAHEKHVISDYSQLNSLIPPGDHHYVVIMTFGYRTDDLSVRALFKKDFRFLGLLGSQTKVQQMFTHYRSEGINEDWLQRIQTPVGLPIKSQTPEEIAVSIAAAIIQEKNKDYK